MAKFPDMNVPCPNCDGILIIPVHLSALTAGPSEVQVDLTGIVTHDCAAIPADVEQAGGVAGQDYYG